MHHGLTMPADLLLPTGLAPTNLRLREGTTARMVESDLYDICNRIREVSRRLYLLELDGDDHYEYAVMEHCDDDVERLVFKVNRNQLDGRVIDKLQSLLAKPLPERLRELEVLEYKWEADRKDAELEDLYERVGRQMWIDLEQSGFITRPVSFPKRGVTGGLGSRNRS